MKSFKSMVVTEHADKKYSRKIQERSIDSLPSGDILIKVKYSSLNYKDALSASGNKGVTRNYPHTPGIDAAGLIVESNNSNFKIGEEVLVTGYDLGMNTSGGFSEYIRVPHEWVIKCPSTLSLKESMIYGTAGFTAALSIYKMISLGVKPENGDILVTGSTGGVGSIAIAILNKLGYTVIAATGKSDEKEMLLKTGAKDIVSRESVNDDSDRPILKERWAGVVDTVGGNILSTALKTTKYNGVVTCCGNVASHTFTSSVYPFILKGIILCGIDSVQCPMDLRIKLWSLLAKEWKPSNLHENTTEISLLELDEKIMNILKGNLKGRTIINI
ncbi:YhdH/YhfP family quinone oxidoreductase [Clostridium grantii]|uniref:Putative quinone oxidoreductase, YhdH/YhfP family n=1 Tax=Clostridium grantii DSM 8605 TaxID=1121316 RepID=A0A1M5X1K0_9CLOT|nr:YhdH/YhfP family quinone oxidoreductase [Clostridium grantii]SHH93756.1 putative quinone oxidoreductase, YhdH/YhfP family [Clostridium grantii DSM 8605]